MKQTKQITLFTLGALSLAFTAAACGNDGPTYTADCVPKGSALSVDDANCDPERHGHDAFVFIYGGSTYTGSDGRRYVRGGTTVMPKIGTIVGRGGTTIGKGGTVLRGGFGGSAKGGAGS